MAITINWITKVINVSKADLELIQSTPTEIRAMDLNWFRLELKNLEDDVEGMTFVDTHKHNPPIIVGGVTLARVVEIINDYTVTFENGQYAVNLYGANSNVGDVINVNQVSIRSANSAGLQTVVSGSGVTQQDKTDIITGVQTQLTEDFSAIPVNVEAQLDLILKKIVGLAQSNFRYMNQVYNSKGNLISGKIKIYNNKEDCNNDANPISTYTLNATYDANNKLINYQVVE